MSDKINAQQVQELRDNFNTIGDVFAAATRKRCTTSHGSDRNTPDPIHIKLTSKPKINNSNRKNCSEKKKKGLNSLDHNINIYYKIN